MEDLSNPITQYASEFGMQKNKQYSEPYNSTKVINSIFISPKSPKSYISETAISATLGIGSNKFDLCSRLHDISARTAVYT